MVISHVYPQYIPWDDCFQTVNITLHVEIHTNQSNLFAGYVLNHLPQFGYKPIQLKHGKNTTSPEYT